MAANEEVTMMMSVLPGAMTGISTMMSGLVSINNVFLDMTRQVDATFGLIDSSIVTAGTVVAQFGLKAAEAFGEFEQGMKVVQMVSNQTAADMDILKQKANEFSVSYRTDIDQITEGLQTLGRAGLNSAAEQTEVLQNGLSTAKLESRELNSVLEELIQNTSLLGGDLKSSDFGEVSSYLNDLLVATSMTAPITTHDVSETLKYSGGIAAAAGANVNTDEGKALLEDYMAAIAAFAQKGVTGSIAGTALRAFFTKPASQDSSVTDALSSIHLKPEYLWEDDEQTMKPVSEQIAIIKNQMDELNVSTMDQLQIWSKIVGGKMGQQMMKLDSDSIKEITKDIQAADSAQSKAAGTFQTFQSNMKEMTEQGQVAFREFGERVAYILNPLIDLVTKFLEILSNPAVSTGLFAGFIALIGQAYQKIKNVFNSLKSEFAEFKKAFMADEKLMAIRPSKMRYRKDSLTHDDFKQAYQTSNSGKAYLKDFAFEQQEELEKKYNPQTLGFLEAAKQSSKGRKNLLFSLTDGSSHSRLSDESFIKEVTGKEYRKNIKFFDLVQFLAENKALKKEIIEEYFEGDNAGDMESLIYNHGNELVEAADNIVKKSHSNDWQKEDKTPELVKNIQNDWDKTKANVEKQKAIMEVKINEYLEKGFFKIYGEELVQIGGFESTPKGVDAIRAEISKRVAAADKLRYGDDDFGKDTDKYSRIRGSSKIHDVDENGEYTEFETFGSKKSKVIDKKKYPNIDFGVIAPVYIPQEDYGWSYYVSEGMIDPQKLPLTDWMADHKKIEEKNESDRAEYIASKLYTRFQKNQENKKGSSPLIGAILEDDELLDFAKNTVGEGYLDSDFKAGMHIFRERVLGSDYDEYFVDNPKTNGMELSTIEYFRQRYQAELETYRQIERSLKKGTVSDWEYNSGNTTDMVDKTSPNLNEILDKLPYKEGMREALQEARRKYDFVSAGIDTFSFQSLPEDELQVENLHIDGLLHIPEEMLLTSANISQDAFGNLPIGFGMSVRDIFGGNVEVMKQYYIKFIRDLKIRREAILKIFKEKEQQQKELEEAIANESKLYSVDDVIATSKLFGDKQLADKTVLQIAKDLGIADFGGKKQNKDVMNSLREEILNLVNSGNFIYTTDPSSFNHQTKLFLAQILGYDTTKHGHKGETLTKFLEGAEGLGGNELSSEEINDIQNQEIEKKRKDREEQRKKLGMTVTYDYAKTHALKTAEQELDNAVKHAEEVGKKTVEFAESTNNIHKEAEKKFNDLKEEYDKKYNDLLNEYGLSKEEDVKETVTNSIYKAKKEADDKAHKMEIERQLDRKSLSPNSSKMYDVNKEYLENLENPYEGKLGRGFGDLFKYNVHDINDEYLDSFGFHVNNAAKSFKSKIDDTSKSLSNFRDKLNDPTLVNSFIGGLPTRYNQWKLRRENEKREKDKDGFLSKLTAPRPDKFIGFSTSDTKIQKTVNGIGNAIDMLGGPWMLAMEGYSIVINYVQGLYDDYCESLKNATNALKEAYSEISSAESGLKTAYKKNNEDATDEDAEMFVLDMYSQIQKDFNNGDWLKKADVDIDKLSKYEYDEETDKYKEVEEEEKTEDEQYKEAIDKNTGALYEAIGQLRLTMDSLATKQMDSIWGMDGGSSKISDAIGTFQDKWMGEGSGFVKDGFLLTASQKDENYAGNKEFAGLLMEDLYDAKGDLQRGLKTIFGSDSKDIWLSMDPKGQKALEGFNKAFGPSGMSRRDNLRLQNSMKNDKKSWQALAKEMAKYQLKGGTWKNLVKKTDVKRLEGYVKKLATETGLTRLQILQGAALQQMQDMYQVAQEKIVPLSAQQAEAAASHYIHATTAQYSTDKSTESGTFGIQNIAAVISSMVAVIAQAKAGEAYYNQELAAGNPEAIAAGSAEEFIKKGMDKNYSFDSLVKSIPGVGGAYSMLEANLPSEYTNLMKGEREKTLFTISGDKDIQAGHFMVFQTMAEQSRNPTMTWDEAYEYAKKKSDEKGLINVSKDSNGKDVITIEDGISYATLMKTARENYAGAITPSLIEQYMGSGLGEVGDDSGSGSGGGSGSGDKDKDQGTRKERVDLVLCNKKEIPKLNVNLFKKAPSFTILNKNFKLRDIKVNTQDKPKAVLASIKNAIIDVQKRTDPKIIQDEEAIYDPVGATDGNTPSGTSDVRTNTG